MWHGPRLRGHAHGLRWTWFAAGESWPVRRGLSPTLASQGWGTRFGWPASFRGGGDDDRGRGAWFVSSRPPCSEDMGHPTRVGSADPTYCWCSLAVAVGERLVAVRHGHASVDHATRCPCRVCGPDLLMLMAMSEDADNKVNGTRGASGLGGMGLAGSPDGAGGGGASGGGRGWRFVLWIGLLPVPMALIVWAGFALAVEREVAGTARVLVPRSGAYDQMYVAVDSDDTRGAAPSGIVRACLVGARTIHVLEMEVDLPSLSFRYADDAGEMHVADGPLDMRALLRWMALGGLQTDGEAVRAEAAELTDFFRVLASGSSIGDAAGRLRLFEVKSVESVYAGTPNWMLMACGIACWGVVWILVARALRARCRGTRSCSCAG